MKDEENVALEPMVKLDAVRDITKKSRSSIYKDIKAGTFPAPYRTGERSVAWKPAELRDWLDNLVVANLEDE